VLLQQDDGDTSLLWRSEISLAAPVSPLHATIRIRLGSSEGSALRPLDYEFGVPAIVRTLLRDFNVLDAGIRTDSKYVELGASNIPELISWIMDSGRRLPIVVVSRAGSGSILLDARSLAGQLAGIAHVRVLSSSHAAWALTDAVGAELGVWGGAVRVYFPGFSLEDDRRQHRLFPSAQVTNSLITTLRSWFGTLSAGSTPEHPIRSQLRLDRHDRVIDALAKSDQTAVQEWISLLEEAEAEQRDELVDLKAQISSLTSEKRKLVEDNETLRESFSDYAKAVAAQQAAVSPGSKLNVSTSNASDVISVSDAMNAVEDLAQNPYYRDGVVLTQQALVKGRGFSEYNNPKELLRAVEAVMAAGVLYHDNKLGMPPMEFFSKRGFGYAAQPSPHLKADEGTSPDQCLRIYWDEDQDKRQWIITSIGPHE